MAEFQENFCEPLAHRECVLMAERIKKTKKKKQKATEQWLCQGLEGGWLVVLGFFYLNKHAEKNLHLIGKVKFYSHTCLSVGH